VRAGDPREVVEAQAENDGAGDPVRRPHAAGNPVDQPDERSVDFSERLRRAAERALCPDRTPAPVGLDWTGISVVGECVQVPARRSTEQRNERRFGELGDLTDGRDPDASELRRRRRPDTPEPLDRQWMKKGELAPRRHQEQPVWFGDTARDLCEELRPRDPDRDRQADPLADLALQPHGDLGWCARQQT
jgi:hypothetical protein